MSTNYDPIAEQYQRAKQQLWRSFVESYTLMELIGDPTGLSVIDLACGEGFYTRKLRQLGAHRVRGADLSGAMIDLARAQEAHHQLGIEYIAADARALNPSDKVDLVVAAYLLNYAQDPGELQAMCDGVSRCLRPGGRFVTVNANPLLHFPTAPSYRKYGFETQVPSLWREGAPIRWIFHLSDGAFEVENYHLNRDSHETALGRAGFQTIQWLPPRVSPEGLTRHGMSYWRDLLEYPPFIFMECVKAAGDRDTIPDSLAKLPPGNVSREASRQSRQSGTKPKRGSS
jgi:ubiquinone/menaquinone biosynthesis C-methylase UbiE